MHDYDTGEHAIKANLEPNLGILSPLGESFDELLPVYSPISLAASEEKRNTFGPIGYLPPHESRRFTTFNEEMNSNKKSWAINIFKKMSSCILPKNSKMIQNC